MDFKRSRDIVAIYERGVGNSYAYRAAGIPFWRSDA
jgi:hypothetical protein